jgi:hypothetical protein
MPLTIGFTSELFFIAKSLGRTVKSTIDILEPDIIKYPLSIQITRDGILDLWYAGAHIWNEDISSETSMFGVESTQNIFRIIKCIDNNDNTWREKYYYREDLNKF